MNPKKHKDILKKLVEEKGFDKSFAEDAVSFFWSDVRKNLSELTCGSIAVRRFGTFVIKHWKIEEFIDSYKKHLDKTEGYTFKEFKYRRQMEEQYKNFQRIYQEMLERNLLKQEVKKKRIEYEDNKTMGQPGQDHGGSDEQCVQEG